MRKFLIAALIGIMILPGCSKNANNIQETVTLQSYSELTDSLEEAPDHTNALSDEDEEETAASSVSEAAPIVADPVEEEQYEHLGKITINWDDYVVQTYMLKDAGVDLSEPFDKIASATTHGISLQVTFTNDASLSSKITTSLLDTVSQHSEMTDVQSLDVDDNIKIISYTYPSGDELFQKTTVVKTDDAGEGMHLCTVVTADGAQMDDDSEAILLEIMDMCGLKLNL